MTSFVWRVAREIEVASSSIDKDDECVTWLPPADILNLLSMVITMIGVFGLPILGLANLNIVKLFFGLGVLLFVSYPFALAGRYVQQQNAPFKIVFS